MNFSVDRKIHSHIFFTIQHATIAQVFALPFPAEDVDPSCAVAYQEHHATGSTGAQVTTDTHHQPPLTVNPKE